MPQGESAEVKSPRRKVIRVESEETQDYACEMLTIGREEGVLCRVLLATHEEPFASATITAVKKR